MRAEQSCDSFGLMRGTPVNVQPFSAPIAAKEHRRGEKPAADNPCLV